MNTKRKACQTGEFKLFDSGSGAFTGYGAVFGNIDSDREIIGPGAFMNLDDFVRTGFAAVGHNWGDLPVATMAEARHDEQGLLVRGDYHSTPEAQAARTVARERLERGKTVGLSIGFRVLPGGDRDLPDGDAVRAYWASIGYTPSSEDEAKADMGARVLEKLHLYEISQVTVPCNELAGLSGVKGDAKGAALGPDVEGDALPWAVQALVERLTGDLSFWMRPPVPGETEVALSRDERLAACQAALAGFQDLAMRLCDGVLSETPPADAAEYAKALARQPAGKGATRFADLPLAARGRAWDAPAALKRVRAWASDGDEVDWRKYQRAHFWFDGNAADTLGGYKLPFCDVIRGELVAVPRGIFGAAGALQGSRGGVDIPDGDRSAVMRHVARYYAKMREEFEDPGIIAPWEKAGGKGDDAPAETNDESTAEAPPAGVPFEQELATALAAVSGSIDRAREVATLRAQEGRTLSDDRRAQLEDLASQAGTLSDALADVLDAARPRATPEDVTRQRAEFEATLARLLGVPV